MSFLTIRRAFASIFLLLAATLFIQPLAFAQPELPRVILDTSYTAPGGRTISVGAGGDFQAALNNAQAGDVILLQAGATFTGNFVLPNRAGSGLVVIRTSALDSSLPSPGTRITPAYASVMPKIVSPNTSPAVSAASGAHHYRFIGIEITTIHADTSSTNYNLVLLEAPGGQTSLSQVPTDIIFDRCYIHGTSTGNVRRGIAANSARTAVIDSYLSDFHEIGVDSQAILVWNGPGPFKIVNNYLEGAGENVMFGGGDPTISNLVPSDIEIRGNHFFKPLRWRVSDPSYAGIHWSVKNLFELKNARRILIDGNLFEHNWADSQNGYAILFTVRNQDGTAPWSVVEDVTFTNNTVRHVTAGINMHGWDNIHPSQQAKRVLIQNNLFDDVGGAQWGWGQLFQIREGTADVVVDHNTAFHTEGIVATGGAPSTGFVYTNNIAQHNVPGYGIGGDGTFGDPVLTLNTYYPGAIVSRNLFVAGGAANYPPDNYFPSSLSEVGFNSPELGSTSPYKGVATDGTDPGVNISALDSALAGVVQNPVSIPAATAETSNEDPLATSEVAPPISSGSASSPSEGGGGGGGGSGGGCFIATAAYGSPLAPQVMLLRAFRDQYLVTHALGQAFVEWYYRTSPPLAEMVRQSNQLRAAVQAVLWPVVGTVWVIFHPEWGMVLVFGASAVALGWRVGRSRPRPRSRASRS